MLLLLAFVPTAARCQRELSCRAGGGGAGERGCEMSWALCEDDRRRTLACSAVLGGYLCECRVGAARTKTFRHESVCGAPRPPLYDRMLEAARSQCGWNLR